MLKEIFEQPNAVRDTMLGRVSLDSGAVFLDEIAISGRRPQGDRQGDAAGVRHVVARRAGRQVHDRGAGQLPVEVDYGSEFRYRDPIVSAQTLAVAITQSGETADTLAALREAKGKGARSLAICNVVGSMATREAEGTIYTHAGPEIGVASTKAFTTQLVGALPARAAPGRGARTRCPQAERRSHIEALMQLPQMLEETLKTDKQMRGDRRAVLQRDPTSSTSAAASTIRSRSKARSS